MFYLTTHSTHLIYGYMASDIWLRTILIVRKETRCRHIGYSYRLTARVLLYAPFHRQNNTYHGLCYTSRGALAGTRNSSLGPPHEVSIRRPIAPWANALPLSYVPLRIKTNKVLKERYLIGQDNAIYNFSTEISLSSKGQNKSKLQKQRRNIRISIVTAAWYKVGYTNMLLYILKIIIRAK